MLYPGPMPSDCLLKFVIKGGMRKQGKMWFWSEMFSPVKDNKWIWRKKEKPSLSNICIRIASEITITYQLAFVPTVRFQRIVQQLQIYHETNKNIMRSYDSRSEMQNANKKWASTFLDESKPLFDFSSCKRVLFANLKCAREKQRAPQIKQSILSDQKGLLKTFIGSIDIKKWVN